MERGAACFFFWLFVICPVEETLRLVTETSFFAEKHAMTQFQILELLRYLHFRLTILTCSCGAAANCFLVENDVQDNCKLQMQFASARWKYVTYNDETNCLHGKRLNLQSLKVTDNLKALSVG